MKQLILPLAFLLFLTTSLSAQTLDWVASYGGNGADDADIIRVDDYGNAYYSGVVYDTVDADPGPGVFNLIANGSADFMVGKIAPNGTWLWAKQFGGPGSDFSFEMEFTPSGNVVLTGRFDGTADFDPGPGVTLLTSAHGTQEDYFLMELDTAGNLVWVNQIGAGGGALSVNASGDIYVGGNIPDLVGTVDVDPGPGVAPVTAIDNGDMLLIKYDSLGNFKWVRHWGTAGSEFMTEAEVDPWGDIIAVGAIRDTIDLDPGPGVDLHSSAGNFDFFMIKLDSAGNYVWGESIGSSEWDTADDVEIDGQGNICVVGEYASTIDFDPGPGMNIKTSPPGGFSTRNSFVAKYDPSGALIWVNTLGDTGFENVVDISLDSTGNLYIAGDYYYSADFDPGPAVYNLIPVGQRDSYIWQLDPQGNLMGLSILEGSSRFGGFIELDVTPGGIIYSCGGYHETTDFDPGPGTHILIAQPGDQQSFVVKFDPCPPIFATDTVNACGSFTWRDGVSYPSSINTPQLYQPGAFACDTIFFLDLTVNAASASIDTAMACGSYTWIDGNTYTNSNSSATVTYTNAVGCDSVIHLDLTLFPEDTTIDRLDACDSLTWIDGNTYTANNNSAMMTLSASTGCDSVVMLDLTIHSPTATTDPQQACDSLTWIDGNTYFANNNTASVTLSTVFGCDSVVTLDLTLTPVNVQVVQAGSTLTAQASGATYQWLNCDSNYAMIPGATLASYTPTTNGNYAVQVDEGSCIDTSACYSVMITSRESIGQLAGVRLFPNPNNGQFYLQFEQLQQEGKVVVFDMLGRPVFTRQFERGKKVEVNTNLAAGVYRVQVQTASGVWGRKMVLE